MKGFRILLGIILISGAIAAQVRIDSSFAFSSNPAKKYSIYVPSSYSPSSPNEMMVGFHPLNLSRWDAKSWCDTLLKFSETNDLLLICPDGGTNGNISDQIDYDFTEALIDSVKKWYNVDTNRIYTFGFSVGGKAVYEFGLSHADIFGGFMSLGPASSSTSGIMQNAGRKPFYLLNGSNDSPNTRFYPMIGDLLDHCAYVDSNLLAGIGHTIDFPNRNQILTVAYNWIDSVNLAPKSGTVLPVSPISFTVLDIKGFHDYPHQFTWNRSTLADTCGTLKYEVMFDLPTGGFVNPLIVAMSDNGGTDTVLTGTNHIIDSSLNSLGVALNTSITLHWRVRSILLGKYSDTSKAFTITFTRKTLGFNLLSPSSNTKVTLVNNSTRLFDWQDIDHYISVKYYLDIDDTIGDFSNPVVTYLSPNNGVNSNYYLPHETLYYDLFFGDNLAIGDSMILKWTVRAEDTFYSEFASSERIIWLIRGEVGFSLISPLNNSIIQSKKDVDYTFNWDGVPLNAVSYEWLFDTLGADLKDTAGVIFKSNNNGAEPAIFITYQTLDSLMDVYNVGYLDTLHGQWTSRALHTGGIEYSLKTYNVSIIRAHPVGLNEIINVDEVVIFPNPAENEIHVSWPGDLNVVQLKLSDAAGRIVIIEIINDDNHEVLLNTSGLNSGIYILNLETGNDIFRSNVMIR